MKKTLFFFAVTAISLTACTPKFTVKGTIEGEQTGNAYLVTGNRNKMDTLAKATITDGKFVFTGSVDSPTDGYLIIEGRRGGTPIFIENKTTLTATLDSIENKIEGSAIQDLANQYFAINNESRKVQAKLSKEYGTATQAKDTARAEEIRKQYNEIGEQATAKKDSLTKANSNSFIAAYMLGMSGLSIEKLTAQFELLGADAKASAPGKAIAEKIAKLTAVEVGQVAPDFTLNTPDGKPLSMHSIKAKIKVLDFWASWCGPCRRENPNVVELYKEYNKKGLEIVGVSLDNDKEAWIKAIADDKLTWPHVSDLKGWSSDVAKLYAVSGIPHIVVLDENNVIIAKNLRGEELKAKIAEILK